VEASSGIVDGEDKENEGEPTRCDTVMYACLSFLREILNNQGKARQRRRIARYRILFGGLVISNTYFRRSRIGLFVGRNATEQG
jgi:hypothetical protein